MEDKKRYRKSTALPCIAALSLATLSSAAIANTPPKAPSGLNVTASSPGSVQISWPEATDTDGVVVGYILVKNGQHIPVGNITSYNDLEINDQTHYEYSILSVDNDGAESATGPVATVSRQSGAASVSVSSQSSVQGSRVCIDPDGDGYGWDGFNTCVVFSSQNNSGYADNCIDTDGDGWGWNGTASCRISSESHPSSATCNDPDGDGWGWDGTKSCIP